MGETRGPLSTMTDAAVPVNPGVTVLMPVFNRERFVDEAIASVVGQDYADLELLIVDDGSTDRTPEILRAWVQRDPRIVVMTSPRNQGCAAALNAGLGRARAPYVARLDSDDIMMPLRLAAQAAVLDREPEVVLVSSAYEAIDVDGNYLATWRSNEPHEVIVFMLNFINAVSGHGQVMYRRSDVIAAGGYDANMQYGEDYDLWVRLLRRGRILSLPLIGMKQRQHEDRLSTLYTGKRPNKNRIQRDSLTHYLGRPVGEEEVAAVLGVWRIDGAVGRAAAGDAIMREAYARFRDRTSDWRQRRQLRTRISRQWIDGARYFQNAGQFAEAARYVARAARWRLSLDVAAAAVRAGSSLTASLVRRVLGASSAQ